VLTLSACVLPGMERAAPETAAPPALVPLHPASAAPPPSARAVVFPQPLPRPPPPPRPGEQVALGPDAGLANPDKLIGLAAADVLRQLGTPTAELDEPPARVWQYTGRTCTFRLIYYLDVVNSEYRTVFYEARSANSDLENAERDCLADIVADRTAGT